MRGRKPELKIVSNTDTPTRSPRAPATLGEVGKAEWRKVCPMLAHGGLLNEQMKSLLTMYCEAVEGAAECAQILKKQGRIITAKGLPPKAHPAVRQQLQYQTMALRYAESLGITATGKARNDKAKANAGNATSTVFD